MTDRGHSMRAFQIGNRFLAGFDAIQEISYMQLELLANVARFILDWTGPEFLGCRSLKAFGASYGMRSGEFRHGVFRRDLPIADQLETRSRNRQATPGSTEFQARLRL